MKSRPYRTAYTLALRAFVALALTGILGGGGLGAAPGARAAEAVNWEHKGFTIAVYTESGLYDSGPALEQLAVTGANSVTFVVTWYQSNLAAADIRRTEKTASDASLLWAIGRARALGLQVILKPQLDSLDEQWRAYIAPADVDGWFGAYAAMLDRYADLGREGGAAVLCMGDQLIALTTNQAHEARWRAVIASARARFAGKLTYSANWGLNDHDEFTQVPFWDALDYLGIAAYFQLTESATPTVEELKASWSRWQTDTIGPLQRRWGKPVLFIEVGYRSVDGAARSPWEPYEARPLDRQEQADSYEALFQSWAAVPWFAGVAFWRWSIYPDAELSPTDRGYEVQHKPALAQVAAGFGGQAGASAPRRQCFAETGKCVLEPFMAYWNAHGGLAINGYPIGDERVETLEDGQPYLVQYFERTRLEYHPENAAPYDVLLGQFGRRIHPADPPAAPRGGAAYFAKTGHNLDGAFLAYWQSNGDLAQFGYPLSEVFEEQLEDGKTYRVQYFERARFEHHPEHAGTPHEVLLGQFGRRILAESAR